MLDEDVQGYLGGASLAGVPAQRAALDDRIVSPAGDTVISVNPATPATSGGPLGRAHHPVDQIAHRRRSRTVLWLVGIDVVALLTAASTLPPGSEPTGAVLAAALLLTAVRGHYRDPVAPSLLDELPSLVGRVLVVGCVAMVLGELVGRPVEGRSVLTLLAVSVVGRFAGYAVVRRARQYAPHGRPTIILGIGPMGRQLAAAMVDHPECGRQPVGWVDDEATTPTELSLLPLRGESLPWLGDVRSLPDLMHQRPDWDVVVADTSTEEHCLVDVLQHCDRCTGEIYLLPRLAELQAAGAGPLVRCMPLVRLPRAAHRSLTWRLKRLLDIIVAGLGLVAISPLVLLCALGVYLEGGPGVIFRQERVGLDRQRFQILKLRSLSPATLAESSLTWSIQGDPRLGPFGKLLRTLSLDELPQLWNVLRGDMTLVGPRPERPYFVEEFSRQYPHYAARHRVPAGLTGWAQISGLRGDTDIAERARYDNAYIANWSLWNDVKILARTAFGFVSRARQ